MRHATLWAVFVSMWALAMSGYAAHEHRRAAALEQQLAAVTHPTAAATIDPAAKSRVLARREADYQRAKEYGDDLVYGLNRADGATPAEAAKAVADNDRLQAAQRKR